MRMKNINDKNCKCGSSDIESHETPYYEKQGYYIECNACGATSETCRTKTFAWFDWNKKHEEMQEA